jgi:N-acetyl-gamma-glutamyl-phosphate reductase
MKKIRAGIVGGAGYTGGELLRLLIRHPYTTVSFIHSRSNAGKPVSVVHTDLEGETDISFSADMHNDIDVLFLCVGHGEAKKFMDANSIDDKVKVIDLSQDFRLQSHSTIAGRQFVYGLPELKREEIRTAKNIANPGCFATAVQLGLLPLAKSADLQEVFATGITGSTGAGQGLSPTSHFSWRANNIQPYKSLSHQHIKEIRQSLSQAGKDAPVHFVPWRGDFTRGILVSSIISVGKDIESLTTLYKEYYRDAAFTRVVDGEISLKQVVNTNKCLVKLEKQDDKLVVHTAIDNLLKGASGQAVQNMNLLFDIDERAGLDLKASAF